MNPIDTLCESTKLRLIANALGLQQCTKTAACIIPLPGTDNVIAIGMKADVARLLGLEPVGATTQASTAQAEPGGTSEQQARYAIDGAIQYGREDRNPPPDTDHWLYEYWNIGRQLAKLGETGWDNVTPLATSSTDAQAAAEVRDAALSEALAVCERVQEECSERNSNKWPELQASASEGAGDCVDAIRALRAGDTGGA